MTAEQILKQHEQTKKIRGRGSNVPQYQSMIVLLRELESEMERVNTLLMDARYQLDHSKNFRRAQVHADRAQQRLHRALKKLAKKSERQDSLKDFLLG